MYKKLKNNLKNNDILQLNLKSIAIHLVKIDDIKVQ